MTGELKSICSNCGKSLEPNEGTIIAGRYRNFILCDACEKYEENFIKWSDED